jgi:hypothetical protein
MATRNPRNEKLATPVETTGTLAGGAADVDSVCTALSARTEVASAITIAAKLT